MHNFKKTFFANTNMFIIWKSPLIIIKQELTTDEKEFS